MGGDTRLAPQLSNLGRQEVQTGLQIYIQTHNIWRWIQERDSNMIPNCLVLTPRPEQYADSTA